MLNYLRINEFREQYLVFIRKSHLIKIYFNYLRVKSYCIASSRTKAFLQPYDDHLMSSSSTSMIFKYLVFLVMVAFACHNPVSEQRNNGSYFDFDKVEYYHFAKTDKELFSPLDNLARSKDFHTLEAILIFDTLTKVSDTAILNEMPSLGFQFRELPDTLHKKINSIFTERSHKELFEAACEAVYRDILIFKKSNRIIGIAKICFSCGQHHIIGTNKNTQFFGQHGEFTKLKNLLGVKN